MFSCNDRWRSTPVALLCLLSLLGPACGRTSNQAADAGAASGESQDPSIFQRLFPREPVERIVPAGTVIVVRFLDTLSSHDSHVGQTFQTRVEQDVAVDGKVAIPKGAIIAGTVTEAKKPKVGGRARLSLKFHTLELPSGDPLAIDAIFARAGKSETPKDAAIIGGSTLAGAILGEAVDEGEGTVIGGIVGGLAGAVGALKTKGKPVTVPTGTVMSLELQSPVTVKVKG